MRLDLPEEWLRKQVMELNKDVPKVRLPLSTLLKMEVPSVETMSGTHYFDKNDLERLESALPAELREKIRLPIVLRRVMESGESVYIIDGGEAEAEVVRRLTGLKFIPHDGKHYYTYVPIVMKLVSVCPTVFVLGVI